MWNVSDLAIMVEYQQSSKELADAAALCNDDPIKQDMVAYISDEFQAAQARSEGIKLLVKKGYSENKGFILEEMKKVIECNYRMASQVRETLERLL